MSLFTEYCKQLLFGGSLKEKLNPPPKFLNSELELPLRDILVTPELPTRNSPINFSAEQIKFPKRDALKRPETRGMALHYFANHELLAIEMMAATLLKFDYPNVEDRIRWRRGVLQTIADEQKHLLLYIKRSEELGVGFGQYPLNDFFWRYFLKVQNLDQYFSLVSLTFENANLDFAKYYMDLFKSFDDLKSSQVMQIVLEDEISHVAFGANWLSKNRKEEDLWEVYCNSLPSNFGPARAKGINFQEDLRLKSGLDSDFVRKLKEFRDDFKIVNRKS